MAAKKKEIKDPVKTFSDNEIRENHVKVDESSVGKAIDIPVKEKQVEEVESFGNKALKKAKKRVRKRVKKKSKVKKITKSNWYENFKVPGPKKLKVGGAVLIITEKPQAAQKIADALAEKKVVKRTNDGVAYYELTRGDKYIQVVCAVGHLFSVAQKKPRNKWPTFEIGWAPNYIVRKNDFTKKYYNTIAKLCKNASELIVATDYDIEGEVIGLNIVRYICNQEDAERMKFSTLTANEIQEAYDNRSATLDWDQGIAGETRHYLDWIYGINLSRALMNAITTTGKFRLMSIGRVQGPALNVIVKKENEIGKFIPEKYWQVFLDVNDDKNVVRVQHVKDISDEKDLSKFDGFTGREGEAKTEKTQKNISPPAPFDLTSLQTEVYKWHKITPSKTLQSAQRLYLAGIISYPRTSSQKIPKEIGYDKILKRLKKEFSFAKFASRKTPIEGKKSDPAHPSIYPTGEFHELDGDDEKIYNLIVKRFISCFCDDSVLDNKKINVVVDGLKFNTKGVAIVEKGWMNVYPSNVEEVEIPDMEGKISVDKCDIEEKLTQPPKRYSPASIISTLEKKNLGTKATRSSILETLYDRGYIKDKSIKATSLGISLIQSLEKNCPIIIDEKLTRDIEKSLEDIKNAKSPLKEEEKILEDTKKIIYKIGEKFEENEEKIGKDLVAATERLWAEQKKENEIMDCKVCGKGKLGIRYGKQYKRYFVACDGYPDCKTTYGLPPNGMMKKTDKICEECGFPMLMALRKGKRPWIFCFNPECASRKKKEE